MEIEFPNVHAYAADFSKFSAFHFKQPENEVRQRFDIDYAGA